jgi:hypothetical protein
MANKVKQVVDGQQQCTRCGEWKPLEDFYKHKKTKSGRNSHCKACENKRSAGFRATDRFKEWESEYKQTDRAKTAIRRSRRKADLKKKYGMSPDDYEAMLKKQNGVCAVCGRVDPKPTHCLSVDHDHKTGATRELLCSTCNTILGFVDDNLEWLQKLMDYVRYHNIRQENSTNG